MKSENSKNKLVIKENLNCKLVNRSQNPAHSFKMKIQIKLITSNLQQSLIPYVRPKSR